MTALSLPAPAARDRNRPWIKQLGVVGNSRIGPPLPRYHFCTQPAALAAASSRTARLSPSGAQGYDLCPLLHCSALD